MRRYGIALTALSVALVLVPAAAPARAATGRAAVAPWIQLELDTIKAQSINPPRASRALAHLSAAMHLAALSGDSGREDAVAGAASVVIRYLHPGASDQVDKLVADLADADSRAFARGRLAGQALVFRAQHDRSDAVWTGTPPVGDRYWVPTPPGYVYPPLEPLAGNWLTWNIRSGSQFRPGPPPWFGSDQFLDEMNEVYRVSQNLTVEQKRIADFWADGAGTVTPPGHWNQIALGQDLSGWSTLQVTRLFAALNTAQADAFIACWDAKFTYWSVRPITAIRRLIDPDWNSYIVTPPFPSYVSGHSTTSGAASTVLGGFFPARAGYFQALAQEASVSRLYGGIHYRSDNVVGLDLGRQVAEAALQVYH